MTRRMLLPLSRLSQTISSRERGPSENWQRMRHYIHDARKAVDNITEITDGIKKGEGTFGKLAKDESLYNETEKAMKKVQKAAEGIQELTPITILGTIFGTFF